MTHGAPLSNYMGVPKKNSSKKRSNGQNSVMYNFGDAKGSNIAVTNVRETIKEE